jgi:hypothetical protein
MKLLPKGFDIKAFKSFTQRPQRNSRKDRRKFFAPFANGLRGLCVKLSYLDIIATKQRRALADLERSLHPKQFRTQ